MFQICKEKEERNNRIVILIQSKNVNDCYDL